MRNRLRSIVDDVGLMEIAVGVALALALVDVARAVGDTLVRFWQTTAPTDDYLEGEDAGTRLALENLFSDDGFEIGGHVLDLSIIAGALVELLLVLALAVWLWPHRKAAEAEP